MGPKLTHLAFSLNLFITLFWNHSWNWNGNCPFQDIGIGVFCYIVQYHSKETKLGSSGQKGTSSAVKNTRVVLVPCGAWKCVHTAVFAVVNISEVLGYHLLHQRSCQGISNITSSIGVSFKHNLSFWFNPLFLTCWSGYVIRNVYKLILSNDG